MHVEFHKVIKLIKNNKIYEIFVKIGNRGTFTRLSCFRPVLRYICGNMIFTHSCSKKTCSEFFNSSPVPLLWLSEKRGHGHTDTRTRTRGHGKRGHGKRGHGKRGHGKCGHGKHGHGKRGHGKRGHGKRGHGKRGHGKRGHGKRGHGKRGHGKPGHGKRGHGKRGQAYKNSCMVDGLPCNRFGLPEKFHISFKY